MTRLRCICAFVLSSCAFHPSGLEGQSLDAALLADAPADAPLLADAGADGALDGPVDPCPVASRPLAIGGTENGNLGGASHYEPTCSVGTPTGPEDFYRVDVPAAAASDLVIDVDDKGSLDSVVDVTQGCVGQPDPGSCESSGTAGAGEVVVIPLVSPGARFVAVDSVAGTSGPYSVRALLRSVVGKGATCSPDLTESRCQGDFVCLDKNDDGVARCEEQSAISDLGNNDTPCTPGAVFDDDGVFSGVVESASDADVIALEPHDDSRVRVVVDDGLGGCAVDLELELLSGANCASAAVVASDDNSGLGPCPLLDVPMIAGNQRHWLRISPVAGAHIRPAASYKMVIDFLPPR